ncbi:MAG: ABC transporter permease [Pseudonocardia sp.]|nr:ABC transporter permease [Pseudonocardia sp.]
MSLTDSPAEAAPDEIVAPGPPAARPRRRIRLRSWLPPLLVFVALVALWYAITYGVLDEQRRFLMPPPDLVVTDALFDRTTLERMLVALGRTARVAFVGLAIAIVIGMAWAVAMSQARWVERSLFPYAVALQCIPILALVPLIGFWFDFGFLSRTIVCVLIALFPIVSNTLFGLQSVDKGQRDLFALHGASRWTTLRKLEFPAAMPAIFAGLRIAAGLSVIGAIVGDLFFKQGDPGLGILIDNYRARLQSPELFLAIIIASLFGIAVFTFFGWLANRVVGRWYDTSKAG